MSLMNVVRIAKLLALLAFVLPWAAVSCNNVDVATASGIELIQGTMSKNPDAGKQFSRQMGSAFGPGVSEGASGGDMAGMDGPAPDLGINFFGIAAAGVIAVGLALSFMGKGKAAARNVMVTSLLGLALCCTGTRNTDADPANAMLARFGGSVTVGGVRIATVTAMHSNGVDPEYFGGELGKAMKEAGLAGDVGLATGWALVRFISSAAPQARDAVFTPVAQAALVAAPSCCST